MSGLVCGSFLLLPKVQRYFYVARLHYLTELDIQKKLFERTFGC